MLVLSRSVEFADEGSVFRGSMRDGEHQIPRATPALRDDSPCEIAG